MTQEENPELGGSPGEDGECRKEGMLQIEKY